MKIIKCEVRMPYGNGTTVVREVYATTIEGINRVTADYPHHYTFVCGVLDLITDDIDEACKGMVGFPEDLPGKIMALRENIAYQANLRLAAEAKIPR